jgi:chitin disaccharide deacetylase
VASDRAVIITADDFGLSEAVNEGVERAHREGVLTSASLMVAGAAASDAVRRARAMPGLRVGLHLVAVEGPAVLSPAAIPDLVGPDGQFPGDQLRLGLRYAFHRPARRQLAQEIAAQFAAFAETGLKLDHADAHKHMHLHPVVGRLMLRAGRPHGLSAIRIPAEPAAVLRRCGDRPGFGARAMYLWSNLLRVQARSAGMQVNDHAFGIAWSGHMTPERIKSLVRELPPGVSEIYFHPATQRDALIARLMPDYEHMAELAALLDPDIRAALAPVPRKAFG